jgi:hypothetical protein
VHYLPLPLPFFALLVGAFLVVVALIQIGILRYAYLRIGISSRAAMALLLGSLIGSCINIPIVELPDRDVQSGVEASHDHRRHRIRRDRHRLRTRRRSMPTNTPRLSNSTAAINQSINIPTFFS